MRCRSSTAPRWCVVAVAVACARAGHAACDITGAMPTTVLPTVPMGGQKFSFVATDDCTRLSFWARGGTHHRTPRPGEALPGGRHRYYVALSQDEWLGLTHPDQTKFTWTVSGRYGGAATSVTTTNELDFDGDGWTRSAGDIGACDRAPRRNPGVAEVCDNGIDDDCDGTVDNCGGDPLTTIGTDEEIHLGLFPNSLSTGDVDGDGTEDLALASSAGDYGAVYLVRGPAIGTIAVEDELTVRGTLATNIGAGVSTGDHDLDGVSDMLTGAARLADGYLFLGPFTTNRHLTGADARLVGPAHHYDGSDVDVDLATDLDGDGQPDVVVGAPLTEPSYSGVLYIAAGPVSGTVALETDAVYTFVGAEFDQLGAHTLSVGDVTGDGIGDLTIARHESSDDGAVYLLEGGIAPGVYDPATVAWATVVAEPSGLYFGQGGLVMSDYDGDGNADLLVGDDNADGAALNSGVVYAFLGPFSGDVVASAAETRWDGVEEYAHLGEAVAAADVDGDDHADVLMGAPYVAAYDGAVYLQRGFTTGTVEVDTLAAFVGPVDGGGVGWSIAPIRDWTGDVGAEVAIGAPGTDGGQGDVYVFGYGQLF
jgi:hypothetical protein